MHFDVNRIALHTCRRQSTLRKRFRPNAVEQAAIMRTFVLYGFVLLFLYYPRLVLKYEPSSVVSLSHSTAYLLCDACMQPDKRFFYTG